MEEENTLDQGYFLYSNKEYQKALEVFEGILNLNQKNYDALNARGLVNLKLKKYTDAIKSFEMAIELDPTHSEAWENKNLALRKAGREAELNETIAEYNLIEKEYLNEIKNQDKPTAFLSNPEYSIDNSDEPEIDNADFEQYEFKRIAMRLDDIFKADEKVAYLLGAGISIENPSNLPSGYRFMEHLLDQIVPAEEMPYVRDLVDYEARGSNNTSFLRFEELVELIYSNYDRSLTILDMFDECKFPNANHFFFANCIRDNHKVITTNFDNLIEHALSQLIDDKEKILPLIHREDWEKNDLKKIDVSGKYPVYKIHGSVSDFRTGVDSRSSLRATLSQITEATKDIYDLEGWKKRVIKPILQKNDLVIIGYSGFDDFDVLPALWKLSSKKRVIWVNHSSSIDLDNIEISTFMNKSSDTEKGNFDRLNYNLLGFVKRNSRLSDKIIRIDVNTQDLLSWLSTFYSYSENDINPINYQVVFSQLNICAAHKWFLTGKIYERHLYTRCLATYETALECAENDNDANLILACLNSIALIYKNSSFPEQAEEYLDKAMGIINMKVNQSESIFDLDINATSLPLMQSIPSTLINKARLSYEEKRNKEAFDIYARAMIFSDFFHDKKARAHCLNGLGLILRDQQKYDEALEKYESSYVLFKELGDLTGIATITNNISGVYRDKKELKESLKFSLIAFTTYKLIGSKKELAINLSNLITLNYELDKYEEAKSLMPEAMKLAELTNNPKLKQHLTDLTLKMI